MGEKTIDWYMKLDGPMVPGANVLPDSNGRTILYAVFSDENSATETAAVFASAFAGEDVTVSVVLAEIELDDAGAYKGEVRYSSLGLPFYLSSDYLREVSA